MAKKLTKEQLLEQQYLKKLAAAKAGKLIRVKCWTDENGSSAETSASTLEDAFDKISRYQEFYANWALEFKSEEPRGKTTAGNGKASSCGGECKCRSKTPSKRANTTTISSKL